MSKFPMLELLRSQEANYHQTTVMPIVRDILRSENRAIRLERENRSLTKAMAAVATKMGERLFENILYKLGQAAVDKVLLACKDPNKTFTVFYDASEIWGFNPDSIQRKLLMAWRDQCLPRLTLRVDDMSRDQRVTTLRFRIPELSYNHTMLEGK